MSNGLLWLIANLESQEYKKSKTEEIFFNADAFGFFFPRALWKFETKGHTKSPRQNSPNLGTHNLTTPNLGNPDFKITARWYLT